MVYPHLCLKCRVGYEDEDVDAYLCEVCKAERLAIAKKIDLERGVGIVEKTPSDLEIYDGFRKQNGSMFVNIKDLGIKL